MLDGVNLRVSKQINKDSILMITTMNGPISRLQLHQKTGLTKMTISNLVAEYIEDGILQAVSTGTETNSVGRKADLIDVVPNSLLTLGVSVEASYIEVGIVNLKGAILRREKIKLSPDEEEESFIRKLNLLLNTIVTDEYKKRLWGVGISSIGPMDISTGKILHLPYYKKIPYLDIVTPLKKLYNLPVYLDNDVNVSSLAELYFGEGQHYKCFIYVSVKAGIGSGVIINNELYHGCNGFSGEMGHVSVQLNGEPCECGNRGCLERYASVPSILQWYTCQSGQKLSDPESSWITLIDGAHRGDTLCVSAIDRLVDYLSAGLTSTVNILDPQCIFLGGDIGPAFDLILPRLKNRILENRFAPIGDIDVLGSQFPGISSFIGTAALVMENNRKLNISKE
jgi:predicted NBD/HSP70 family sugar kinase